MSAPGPASRGFGQVTATVGVSTENPSKTVTVYMQGMNGDKEQGTTTTRSATVSGIDFPGLSVPDLTDSDQYSGFAREQITYDGATPISVEVNDPWSNKTATQHKSYANVEAYYVRTAKDRHPYLPDDSPDLAYAHREHRLRQLRHGHLNRRRG